MSDGDPSPPCRLPGVDKENVQLSPSSALSSGSRTRHGSASQVQKQRSAGSFKRPSIKKIVWSAREQPPPPSSSSPTHHSLACQPARPHAALHFLLFLFPPPSSSAGEQVFLCFALRGNISKGKLEFCAAWDFFLNLSFETVRSEGQASVESFLESALHSVQWPCSEEGHTCETIEENLTGWWEYSLDIKVECGQGLGLWQFTQGMKDPDLALKLKWNSRFINTPVCSLPSVSEMDQMTAVGGLVDLWDRMFTLDLLGHLSSPLPSLVHILHRQIMYN